jgi:hypothetical protein
MDSTDLCGMSLTANMTAEANSSKHLPRMDPSADASGAPSPSDSQDSDQNEEPIATLLGVFRGKTPRGEERIFVGLTIGDLPIATTKAEALNAYTRSSVDAFLKSGLELAVAPFDVFVPMLFRVVVPSPIDYEDTSPRQRARDVLRIGAIDGAGKSTELYITELDLVDGIVAGRTPWQTIKRDRLGSAQDSVSPLYTVFVRTNTAKYALLFKPTLPDTSNKDVFASFVTTLIKQLIEMDSRHPPQDQHGYLAVAQDYKKKTTSGGSWLDLLTTDAQGKEDFKKTLGSLRHALSTDSGDRAFMNSKAEADFVDRIKFEDLLDMVAEMQARVHRFFRTM